MWTFIFFTVFVFLCGVAIGATFIRDALDGLWITPRRRKPIVTLPVATIYLYPWKHLDAPTVTRRKEPS